MCKWRLTVVKVTSKILTWQTHEHEKGLEADNHQKRCCLNGLGLLVNCLCPICEYSEYAKILCQCFHLSLAIFLFQRSAKWTPPSPIHFPKNSGFRTFLRDLVGSIWGPAKTGKLPSFASSESKLSETLPGNPMLHTQTFSIASHRPSSSS